jgi:hypothetical protein
MWHHWTSRAVWLFTLLLPTMAVAGPQRPADLLPVVDEVDWEALRSHSRELLTALASCGGQLPAETTGPLRELLDHPPADHDEAAQQVQRLLDRHCLLGVTINPESRVKAARGAAAAELRLGRTDHVLVKVKNEGGVTHALRVAGPGLRGIAEPGGWLEAEIVARAPLRQDLSGAKVEYRILRLTPREAGKREATFQLDVGQGTQDLGFRAETPILFTVAGR